MLVSLRCLEEGRIGTSVWEKISRSLKSELDVDVTPICCNNKWKSLKKDFKRYNLAVESGAKSVRPFPYIEEFKKCFADEMALQSMTETKKNRYRPEAEVPVAPASPVSSSDEEEGPTTSDLVFLMDSDQKVCVQR